MPPQLDFESETRRTPGTVHPARSKPELLAPAGDRTCLIAAVENGADAVYFGLQRHNARIRAANFDGADLPEVMALLHRRGRPGLRHAQHAGLPRASWPTSKRPSASWPRRASTP